MDTYAFDKFMQLADGALASTTNNQKGQVGGASKILDLGAALPRTDLGIVGELGRMKVAVVIDVSAIITANVDDTYHLDLMGSNNSDGSAPVHLGGLKLGNFTLIPNGSTGSAGTGAGSTTVPGRFIIFADMIQNDVAYEYLYLNITLAGTAKSITFTAFASRWPWSQ